MVGSEMLQGTAGLDKWRMRGPLIITAALGKVEVEHVKGEILGLWWVINFSLEDINLVSNSF